MPSIEDIIQKIVVEGDREIIASFTKIGDSGKSAFDVIAGAAAKTNAPLSSFQGNLATVEQKATAFGRSIASVGSSVGTFVGRVAAAGAGLALAGGAIIKGTLGISTALKSVQASVVEQRLAASQNAGVQKQIIQRNFEQVNALADLRNEYLKGKIGINEYLDQQQELLRTQARARAQARELALDQEDIRKEQAKDTAAAQQQALIVKLQAQYGGALTSVLVQLANVLDTVRQRFITAFGPQVANFLTSVVQGISASVPTIIAQFDRISKAIQQSFGNSGSTIKGVIEGIVKFMGDAADVVIKVVIPAFQQVLNILNVIAGAINAVFGTNFNASSLIAIGIILKITGLFGVLFSSIGLVARGIALLFSLFLANPIVAIIAVIVALILTQLIPALLKFDWAAFGKTISDTWSNIVKVFTNAFDIIKAGFGAVSKWFNDRINDIVGFFDGLIQKVKDLLTAIGLLSGGSNQLSKDAGIDDIGKFAGGGLFRGRSGVDTNLALLTDGEFIVKRSRVRELGVGFLNRLNQGRGRFAGAFNTGGLVGSFAGAGAPVRFAEGGLNGGNAGRPLTLVIGDQEFNGLTVQDDTANRMSRYASRRGIRSTGRKPLWFGGSK